MNHQEILNKKLDRLNKYTGSALNRKKKAYEKAVAKFNIPSGQGKSNTPTFMSSTKTIETGTQQWIVGNVQVSAKNEKDARAEARKALKLKALPPGTKVIKVP